MKDASGKTNPRLIALKPISDAIRQSGVGANCADAELLKPVQTPKLLAALTDGAAPPAVEKAPKPSEESEQKSTEAHKPLAPELTDPVVERSTDKTILIVDDNKTNRKLIDIFLNRLGVAHHSASDGADPSRFT